MKIAINTLAHRKTGGGLTYFRNILPRLEDDEHQYIVFVPADRNSLTEYSTDSIKLIPVRFPVHLALCLVLYEQLILPIQVSRLGYDVDILFCPADTAPLISPVPLLLAIRNMNTFSNAGLKRFSLHRRFKFRVQQLLTYMSARRACRVFFVSHYSKEVCNQFLNLPEEKLSVICHGIEHKKFEPQENTDNSEIREQLQEKKPYLLSLSTLNEHKNLEIVIQAFGQLDKQFQTRYSLLIAGRKQSTEYVGTLKRLARDKDVADKVHLLGEIDYKHIEVLYQEATIFVHPAIIESFGHPLVEAMAAGTPLVASDVAAIPEVADDAAMYFDPEEPNELAGVLRDVLQNPEKRNQLSERGQRQAAKFSWDNHIEDLTVLFREVYDG